MFSVSRNHSVIAENGTSAAIAQQQSNEAKAQAKICTKKE
jgi:hypothetical protein